MKLNQSWRVSALAPFRFFMVSSESCFIIFFFINAHTRTYMYKGDAGLDKTIRTPLPIKLTIRSDRLKPYTEVLTICGKNTSCWTNKTDASRYRSKIQRAAYHGLFWHHYI